MLIYRHHRCCDIIDIDDESGQWMPVEEDDENPTIVGLMTMAQRARCKIGGSYAIEGDRRFYFHWTEEGGFVFRTDDLRLALFRRARDGGLIELLPHLTVELAPAAYGDGRKMPGMCTFTVSDGDKVLVEVTYDAARYVRHYHGNFTMVPDEDLGDWDFFVAVERELVELRQIARARAAIEGAATQQAGCGECPVKPRTGEPAPRAGNWSCVYLPTGRWWLEQGEAAPPIDDSPCVWVWVPPWDENAAVSRAYTNEEIDAASGL